MTIVWRHYRKGGSEKLAMLALADWCDDEGGNLRPSIGTVAKKICSSESQARRIVHGFLNDGLLEVVGNHHGGAPGTARHYRLNLEKLAQTPSIYDTPRTNATPSMGAREGLHGCARRVAPMTPNTPVNINKPSLLSDAHPKSLKTKVDNKAQRTSKHAELSPAKQNGYPTAFDETWAAYPSRPGASKKNAYRAWAAQIKSGATAQEILSGVMAYAAYVTAKRTAPQFIKQPSTFFGPDEHYRSDWSVATEGDVPPWER